MVAHPKLCLTEKCHWYNSRATSVSLFSAAVILAVELKFHRSDANADYLEEVQFCINFLNGVKDQSIVAARAVELLEAQMLTIWRINYRYLCCLKVCAASTWKMSNFLRLDCKGLIYHGALDYNPVSRSLHKLEFLHHDYSSVSPLNTVSFPQASTSCRWALQFRMADLYHRYLFSQAKLLLVVNKDIRVRPVCLRAGVSMIGKPRGYYSLFPSAHQTSSPSTLNPLA